MSESVPGVESLPHAVFLRRMAGASPERSLEARLGRAAFVTLRLVDLLDEQAVTPDAFHYQHGATERACHALPADGTESSHLVGVVASTAAAYHTRDNRQLFPALFAYAHFLEDELRLEEALDVLETLARVGDGDALRAEDRVAARLRTARVLRKLNRFDAAERAYEEAGALAVGIGDRHSHMLSRIGRAEALRGRGNLGDAERSLWTILAEVDATNDHQAQALSHHVLGAVLHTSGQPAKAIPHVWHAVELYDDELSRTRAFGDLGTMLLMIGQPSTAERAFKHVLNRPATGDVRANALIELMNCASHRRDRVGFERWREQCEERRDNMSPNILVDFLLKVGIGRARFGQFDRAHALLAEASQTAQAVGLHEFVFRIGRIQSGLEHCQELACESIGLNATESENAAVREVAHSLEQFES